MLRYRLLALVATPARGGAFYGTLMGSYWFAVEALSPVGESSSLEWALITGVIAGVFTGVLWWLLLASQERPKTFYASLSANDRVEVMRSIRTGDAVDPRLAGAVVEQVGRLRAARRSPTTHVWTRRVLLVVCGAFSVFCVAYWFEGGAAVVTGAIVGGFWVAVLLGTFLVPSWRDPSLAWQRADRAEAEAVRLLRSGSSGQWTRA